MKRLLILIFTFLVLTKGGFSQPAIGTLAPDISLPNANGDITKLSSLKGKVVLLDFWASWCGPCRVSNRQLSSVYEKNKSKGFEIFGVSLDANKSAWTRAIGQDKIKWMQVVDTKAASGNQLTQTWRLYYIPATFLLDKEGIIVAVNPGKAELDKLLKKLL